MSGKIYSHIDKIPSGSASRKVTEGCLVLEGGAFRGLYSQGSWSPCESRHQYAVYHWRISRSYGRDELCGWSDWSVCQSEPEVSS